ncbi:MAG: hypothetical protein AB8B46_00825 [Candidatus Midichloriaceae bacterium]
MKLEKLTPMYSYRGNGNFMFELSLKILTGDTFFGDNRGIKDYVSSFLTKECPKVNMKLTFGKSTDNEYDFIYRDTERTLQGTKETMDQLGSYANLNNGAVAIYPEMFEPKNPNYEAYQEYKSCTDTIQTYTEKSIICDDNIPGTYLCASDLGETPLIIPN